MGIWNILGGICLEFGKSQFPDGKEEPLKGSGILG